MEIWEQFLGDEERLIREAVRDLADSQIAPRAEAIDDEARFPSENVAALAELGLMALPIPEEYGGAGGSTLSYLIAVEEVARACATTSLVYMTQTNGALALLVGGSEEQKRRWLPEVASGRKLTAMALTEPGGGSDFAALRTRADQRGDQYMINGTKTFITNGAHADLVTVYAKTEPGESHRGVTAFLVEKGTPGFRVGKVEKKMGMRGSDTAELVFEEVAVPATNIVGAKGQGFRVAMGVLNKSRLSCSAQALGIAQGAYEIALQYARERQAFGKPIGQHQLVQAMLADMYMGIAAARMYLYGLARAVDSQKGPFVKEAATAKTLCSDLAMRVTNDAIQVLGGYGYIRDYQVERMMRDAKVTQIYEGTNQILRVVIAREVVGRG